LEEEEASRRDVTLWDMSALGAFNTRAPNLLVGWLGLIVLAAAGAITGALSVALAYVTEPLVSLAVVGAFAAVVLTVVRPMTALYIAVTLIPLELYSFQLGPAGLTPAEAMFALTGAGWAIGRVMRGQAPFRAAPLGVPLALLILAVVPGMGISEDIFRVAKVFIMWSCMYFVYQMVVAEGRPDHVEKLLLVLAISAAVISVMATVASGVAQPELVGTGEEATGRAHGAFGSPNTLGTFEALAMPGALALALGGTTKWRPLGLASFILIFAGLALSLSRGGFLAAAGALATMLAWPPFRRFALISGLVIVLITNVSGGDSLGDVHFVQVITGRIASTSYSAQGVDPRFDVWRGTPRLIEDNPVFGVGENNFPLAAPRYGLFLGTETYEHAHNIPLTVTAELGFVGLAALLWVAIALARELVTAYLRAPGYRGLVWALIGAFAAITLQGMVDYTLRPHVIVGVIVSLAGCATVLSRAYATRPVPAGRAPPRGSRRVSRVSPSKPSLYF
jgi:O-antigen ligase